MLRCAAAAFAIDALYSKLTDMLASSERPALGDGVKRAGRIVETLKRALELGKLGDAWQKSIPGLFAQRDALVHFKGEIHPAGIHPSGKAYVSLEQVTYAVEAATSAVDLTLEILTTAIDPHGRSTAPSWPGPRTTPMCHRSWSEYAPPFAEPPEHELGVLVALEHRLC